MCKYAVKTLEDIPRLKVNEGHFKEETITVGRKRVCCTHREWPKCGDVDVEVGIIGMDNPSFSYLFMPAMNRQWVLFLWCPKCSNPELISK